MSFHTLVVTTHPRTSAPTSTPNESEKNNKPINTDNQSSLIDLRFCSIVTGPLFDSAPSNRSLNQSKLINLVKNNLTVYLKEEDVKLFESLSSAASLFVCSSS